MPSPIPYLRLSRFFGEMLFGFVLVATTILWMDCNKFFVAIIDDHNQQRWLSLESFQDSIDIDVMVVGNSHAFTGINPKQLSASLGATSFLLANNGILMKDAYWNLKDALELSSPQLLLIETSLMSEKSTTDGELSVLYASMNAICAKPYHQRRIESVLDLFEFDHTLYPFSQTLLNHHLLLTKPDVVYRNIALGPIEPQPSAEKLFLGRHVRYAEGITAQGLAAYDESGPWIFDEQAIVSDENALYTEKIVELARQHGCKVAFVSLPYFHRHLSAETAEKRLASVTEVLAPLNVPHLNLQAHRMQTFPSHFQEVSHPNQHMTLVGSMGATAVISTWIDEVYDDALRRPGREGDSTWHAIFEMEEGYLSYHPAQKGNPGIKYLMRDVWTPQLLADEIVIFEINNTKRDDLDCFVKIDPHHPDNASLERGVLQMALQVQSTQGTSSFLTLELQYDSLLEQEDLWVFRSPLPKLSVQAVKALRMQ